MRMRNGFLFSLLMLASTLVQAAEYEEVSYEDLVNQINKRKSTVIRNANDPLDQNLLHAGFGLISSAHTLNTSRGRADTRYQTGFQLTLGIDLFSPQWSAETALRNFGQTSSGSETWSLREFDLKLMNRDMLSASAGYRVGAGLGNRYLKLEDPLAQLSVNDNTPTAVFFGGLDIFLKKNLSLGIESGLRTSMVTDTTDKNSFALTVRLDTHF